MNNRIGILFCGLIEKDLIEKSLSPWLQLKKENPNNVFIGACSVFFKEYAQNIKEEDTARPYLQGLLNNGIDYLLCGLDGTMQEHAARNNALQYLLSQNVDLIWIVDADELYSIEQIKNILNFINNEEYICWFKLCLKNYVFDDKTYLVEPFSPPRVFRIKLGSLRLKKIYWDNDVYYGINGEDNIDYKRLPNMLIPKNVAWVKHLSWLNNERSKEKVRYQVWHFGHCGYKWNELENKLEFNQDFYRKNNLSIPEIEREQ